MTTFEIFYFNNIQIYIDFPIAVVYKQYILEKFQVIYVIFSFRAVS